MDAISPKISANTLNSPWQNDAIIDRLKATWKYYSASQIAKMLSEEFRTPVTRNAVIGKISRLGLTGGGGSKAYDFAPKKGGAPRQHRTRTRIVPSGIGRYRMMHSVETDMEPLREATVEPALNLTLQDRRNDQCHFPAVHEGEWLYCGHPTAPGKPYCAGHVNVMYAPQAQRRQRTVPAWR